MEPDAAFDDGRATFLFDGRLKPVEAPCDATANLHLSSVISEQVEKELMDSFADGLDGIDSEAANDDDHTSTFVTTAVTTNLIIVTQDSVFDDVDDSSWADGSSAAGSSAGGKSDDDHLDFPVDIFDNEDGMPAAVH